MTSQLQGSDQAMLGASSLPLNIAPFLIDTGVMPSSVGKF